MQTGEPTMEKIGRKYQHYKTIIKEILNGKLQLEKLPPVMWIPLEWCPPPSSSFSSSISLKDFFYNHSTYIQQRK